MADLLLVRQTRLVREDKDLRQVGTDDVLLDGVYYFRLGRLT